MGREIQSMFVDRAPATLIYEASPSTGFLFLEEDGAAGRYKIRLSHNQYRHSGNETGNGHVSITFVDGRTFEGLVVSTFPASVPVAAYGPIDLEVNIESTSTK